MEERVCTLNGEGDDDDIDFNAHHKNNDDVDEKDLNDGGMSLMTILSMATRTTTKKTMLTTTSMTRIKRMTMTKTYMRTQTITRMAMRIARTMTDDDDKSRK